MSTESSLSTERYLGIDLHKHYLVTGAPWTHAVSMPNRRSYYYRVASISTIGRSGQRPISRKTISSWSKPRPTPGISTL
jgi:hypothetical protein